MLGKSGPVGLYIMAVLQEYPAGTRAMFCPEKNR
jgi:hypothetical protein